MSVAKNDGWQVFELAKLQDQLRKADTPVQFETFLKSSNMHCGLYFLKQGATDMQTPHDDDELYYVLEGKAKLRVGSDKRDVMPGMLLYVKASEEHSFFEVEEDMTLLVIFA